MELKIRNTSNRKAEEALDFFDSEGIAIHSLLIAYKDEVIAESYYQPFNRDTLHRMYSVTKSINALGIGILLKKGLLSLDDKLSSIFPEYITEKTDDRVKRTSIRNLLMMKSPFSKTCYKNGVRNGNNVSTYPDDWILSFFTEKADHDENTFFSYDVNEALHLSERERHTFIDCLMKIEEELQHSIDRMSKRLIATNIELLLNYCLRFYERQFITRQNANRDILNRFEALLDYYFTGDNALQKGLPTVKYCAGELCLSPNYFGDLIKRETGKTALEWIQDKIVGMAKERLLLPSNTISQIAYSLGFQYPQHFTRVFKKVTGITPNEYRGGNRQ